MAALCLVIAIVTLRTVNSNSYHTPCFTMLNTDLIT